jgi:hypothetical protein
MTDRRTVGEHEALSISLPLQFGTYARKTAVSLLHAIRGLGKRVPSGWHFSTMTMNGCPARSKRSSMLLVKRLTPNFAIRVSELLVPME